MINPVHKVKRYVVKDDGTKYWYETEVVGWLPTGIRDRYGKMIYEGDRLKIFVNADEFIVDTVIFHDSLFKCSDIFLTEIESLDMEVVGHVTEEEE